MCATKSIFKTIVQLQYPLGFPGGSSGKESACQSKSGRRRRFDPWVGKIPWRKKWQPTPVFLPGQSHGWSCKELDTTERLNRQTLAYYTILLSKWIVYCDDLLTLPARMQAMGGQGICVPVVHHFTLPTHTRHPLTPSISTVLTHSDHSKDTCFFE